MVVVVALVFALQSPAHAQAQADQAGTVALSTITPQVGVAVTATLTDPDTPVTGTTWEWSSSDTSDGTFTAISGATSASYTPVAADHGKYLKATASYTDMHGSGKSAEQVADNAVANVPVTVSISVPDASVAEGDSATVTVTLSADPKRTVVIPITTTNMDGASDDDYSGVPEDVTFNNGETTKTFTFMAVDDTDADHGDSVAGNRVDLGFGTLPDAVSQGTESTITITIVDDDPAVTVSFSSATYSVDEGLAASVTVTLNAAPMRPLRIPFSATLQGGATAADFDANNITAFQFGSDDTEMEFSYRTEPDTVADHGESVRLSFGTLPPGVTASGTTTTTITIIDDDPAVEVEFASTTYSAAEGTSATVTVTLSADPKRPLTIPITSTAQGSTTADDYTIFPTEVTFASGQTSRTLELSALQDSTPDDGDSVKLGFGSDLPPGVTEGTDDETTVTIIDDDPAVTVSFGAGAYSVDESGTVDVTLTLSAAPQRPVTIPIIAAGQSGADSDDYDEPGSVTFASGDTSMVLTFTPEDDDVDDDGEKVRLSFGLLPPGVSAAVSASTPVATVVSINDDDDPEVTVMFGKAAYSVNEKNNGTVTVMVTLSANPERTVSIPLSTSYDGGADSDGIRNIPSSVSFSAGETSKTFTVTAWDDFIDNDGRTATISFGTPPSRVTEGSIPETVVSVTDDETRGVNVFPTARTIGESDTGTYSIYLLSEPTSPVTITISDPASGEASAEPALLTFNASNFGTPRSIVITPTDDDLDEPTETATFTHALSGGDYGANNVTIPDFVVTITDNDETPVISGSASQNFPETEWDDDSPDLEVATYSATDGDGDDIEWSLSGTDSDFFEFTEETDGDLVLSFDGAAFSGDGPDFENPEDDGSNNTYEVTVEASDGTNTGTRAVTVTVTPVDETPSVTGYYLGVDVVGATLNESSYEVDPPVARRVGTFEGEDEEGQSLTWTLGGTDGGDFRFEPGSDPNRIDVFFKNPPDYENPADSDGNNQYLFTARASDGTNTGERAYIVLIRGINEPPEISKDPVPDYPEIEYDFTGTPPAVHTFTAVDYDAGDGGTFDWSMQSANELVPNEDGERFRIGTDEFGISSGVSFGTPTAVLTFSEHGYPDFEKPRDYGSDNVYEAIIRVKDDEGAYSAYTFQVRITPVDERPELTGTPVTARSYDENATEAVADYDARDEEGATIAWSLTGDDRGDFDISTDGIVTFKATPNFEDPKDSDTDNVYTFTVVASDGGRTTSVDVTVTVADLEEDGVITVSNTTPGVGGEDVRFELSDGDGGIQVGATNGFVWTVQGRTSATSPWQDISSSNTGQLFVVYTPDEDHTGQEIRAIVDPYTDRRGAGKSAASEPTEAVRADPIANAPPRLRETPAYTIAEGPAGAAGRRRLGNALNVTDRDGDTLTFAIVQGVNSQLFAVDASGQLWVVRDLDFETTPSPSVRVAVHDGKGVDADNNEVVDTTVDITVDVTVTVTDVEEPGVLTLSAKEPALGVTLDATLEDGDGNVSGETWTWARSEDGRTDWFNIADETSSAYTPKEDDEEFYLRARVEYTDNRGAGKSAEAITDDPVPSKNRRPVFPDSEDGERTVDENTRANGNVGAPVAAVDPERNRLTYTLTGTDADAFTITNAGQIRVKDALDFETKESYSVTVNVHDGRDGAGATDTEVDDTQDVTITVENVEEAGMVTLTTLTGVVQARVEVTAALTDDDVATGVTWRWSHSPNGRTNWANISGATGATYTPADDFERRYIRATASYTDGHGPNKVAHGISPRVAGPPPVNSAPAFPSTETGMREVAEDALGGANVGDPVEATDLNAGDFNVNAPLVYSLTGTDAASFAIDAASGQISLAQNVTLDYEGKRSYRVTVEVTDGHDELGDDEDPDVIDARQNVTINVTDVNEAPAVTGDGAVSVEENINRAIATYDGTDPERDTLTWSVSGADSDNFWVSDRGQLYFATPPSFEGVQTSYSVTVTATDDDATTPLSGSFNVTVTVTDVEEEGTIRLTPPRGWDGTEFTARLNDDDSNSDGEVTGNIIWRWMRSSGRSGGTVIPGATSDSYTATVDDVGQYLRVTATYEDRRGAGKEAEAVLTVRIGEAADRPATNTDPAFAEATDTRSIGQGTAAGRNIGAPVRATDEDTGDVLYYWLSGDDHRKFDIDSTTGQLKTKAVLDYDPDPQGTNTYAVTINVSDGFDGSYSAEDASDDRVDVTITVTAVRQPPPGVGGVGGGGFGAALVAPRFTDGFRTSRSLAVNARPGDAVGDPVAATHPEDDVVTYSLSGANTALFTVDEETGQIRLGQAVALELGQTYTVNLTATDTSGTGAIIIVDIEVTEAPPDPYDANRNGIIEKDEVLAAIADYFAGLIEKDEVLELVARYLAA